jgi:predicted RNA-binding protein YlqC (UPF0109 family)
MDVGRVISVVVDTPDGVEVDSVDCASPSELAVDVAVTTAGWVFSRSEKTEVSVRLTVGVKD